MLFIKTSTFFFFSFVIKREWSEKLGYIIATKLEFNILTLLLWYKVVDVDRFNSLTFLSYARENSIHLFAYRFFLSSKLYKTMRLIVCFFRFRWLLIDTKANLGLPKDKIFFFLLSFKSKLKNGSFKSLWAEPNYI